MNKKELFILVPLLFISLIGVGFYLVTSSNSLLTDNQLVKQSTKKEASQASLEKKVLDLDYLEIADEARERNRGLMYRESLCWECGVLFIFENPIKANFWMKNTYIPLDIIFVKDDGIIDKIHTQTKTNQTMETYGANSEILYVLEFNSGYAKEKGLKEGQIIDTKHLINQGKDFVWVDEK